MGQSLERNDLYFYHTAIQDNVSDIYETKFEKNVGFADVEINKQLPLVNISSPQCKSAVSAFWSFLQENEPWMCQLNVKDLFSAI